VVLEICNRPWNDSPTDQLAGPDDSHDRLAPLSETLAEKLDDLIEAKSPSPSLGPSQSASQHGRSFPHTDGTVPQADVNSKYFLPKIPNAAQTEQQTSYEKQRLNPVSVFLTKQAEKMTPASYLETISPPNQLSDPVSLDDHADTSNLTKYLDMQVTQHKLAPPEIAPCLQPGPTEHLTFCSWQPVFDVDAQADNRVDSELIDLGCAAWGDSEHSVDHCSHDRHLWPSVDYDDGLYPLVHDCRDVPEDIVSCYSHTVYDAREHYLYHDYGKFGGTNIIIPAYDLTENSEAEHSNECMIDPTLTFSDNGEHKLVEGHIAGCHLYPDSNDNGEYEEEYFGDEHGTLELDDAWDQCCSENLNGESYISLWNPGSTSSNDLDSSLLSNSEPIHPAAMFSQGRALLVESTQDDGNPTTTVQIRRPLLSLVEADVAKSLRNHWLPQKL
jgi:hypothetical protein